VKWGGGVGRRHAALAGRRHALHARGRDHLSMEGAPPRDSLDKKILVARSGAGHPRRRGRGSGQGQRPLKPVMQNAHSKCKRAS
jgi:hypothetical protein